MDFFTICMREGRKKEDPPELYVDFNVGRSKDLMVRGRAFYAIWDEELGLWSTDEYDVQRLVDHALTERAAELQRETGIVYNVKHLRSSSSQGWYQFRKWLQNISDNSHDLDSELTFANTEVKKADYRSKRLPYALIPGDHSAWDELVGTLYSVEERAKIEWLIGALVAGDAKKIHKFGVFYGPPMSGKSTVMNIMSDMFEGYTTTFDAKALGSSNSQFSTEVFRGNPLLAIQQDGDLSRIEDNTKINSIVAHEPLAMNEKFKPTHTGRVHALLIMGTNQPVKITDAKSGIIRRLIDIHPTGVTIPKKHYDVLMSRISFEHGAIAQHCLEVYLSMGKNYYNGYRPLEMMLQTDIFFNFIEAHYDLFRKEDGTSLQRAYSLYKEWAGNTGIERVKPMYQVREELRNYFDVFKDRAEVGGVTVRSYYSGFNANKFKEPKKNDISFSLVIEETESLLDDLLAEQPAQYATRHETPRLVWEEREGVEEWVKTKLSDLDTKKLHFVKVPENHIIIDFDLKDSDGTKSLERNLEAASAWPATYAELSKSGAGVHLHYDYDGDASLLRPDYSEGIEVKVYRGNSSLRRRLSKCNNVPVAVLTSGHLPQKEKKPMLDKKVIGSEKALREQVLRNLRKEVHSSTKSSIDFIKKILDDAYEQGLPYDLTDMRGQVFAFANSSSNQAFQCIKTVQQMKFMGQEEPSLVNPEPQDGGIVFFDVEVYPNLLVICWMAEDSDQVVRMINPSPESVEKLLEMKLVGFNNRRYDNHIIWARMLGYSIEQIYELSQKMIVLKDRNATFGEAYGASYADIYDFSSKKQSLKMFQIELGLHHIELDIPWDQPVSEELWLQVADYCANDVISTKATFFARKADFQARQILADLSGLTVNDTTARHTAKIIFGNDRDYKGSFVYTDLSKEFPGYVFDMGKSSYRGEDPSEGGYVYSEPGIYEDVAVLDVASMHPTSIIELNLFGEYTPRFKDIMDARLAIKRGQFEDAREMLGGKLRPYLEDTSSAKDLAYALKIVINIVYGMTSAKFDNPFRDNRNHDNIVAKRGALFMIDLKHFVQERGFQVVHIKTDSIKIPGATDEIIRDVELFGQKYGYHFEHEVTYDKFCLVNDAVYIAKKRSEQDPKHWVWDAVGAQFQHPYVYKKLFSGEDIDIQDLYETKQVQKGTMYLDFDAVQTPMHSYQGMVHVGRTGRFLPITKETGGGVLYTVRDGKKYATTGTTGFFWMEADMAEAGINEDKFEIDMTYFEGLVEKALATISKFGDYVEFTK